MLALTDPVESPMLSRIVAAVSMVLALIITVFSCVPWLALPEFLGAPVAFTGTGRVVSGGDPFSSGSSYLSSVLAGSFGQPGVATVALGIAMVLASGFRMFSPISVARVWVCGGAASVAVIAGTLWVWQGYMSRNLAAEFGIEWFGGAIELKYGVWITGSAALALTALTALELVKVRKFRVLLISLGLGVTVGIAVVSAIWGGLNFYT